MLKRRSNAILVLPIGLMLFSFFFGAGNLIFPPILGQQAGHNLWSATLGFCLTGVGFPLLGILAMAINRHATPDDMAMPVHPTYAKTVTILSALTIGPFFAIPRTAAVSYDTGMMVFLPAAYQGIGQAVYSLLFFMITYFLAIRPSKIVDNIGKIMTPLLLLGLAVLLGSVFAAPMSPIQMPTEAYNAAPFFKGFSEGYNTMDLLCSMLFSAAAIRAIEYQGITEEKEMTKMLIGAGLVAAACLGFVYASIAYAGATSVALLGLASNGAQLLSQISLHYFGSFGEIVLALIIFFACITTSVGLVTSISSYFAKETIKSLSYERLVLYICIFSFAVSNIGLTNIIQFAIPVLCILYPITIAMVILNIGKHLFKGDPHIFRSCLGLTTVFAIFDGLRAAGIDTGLANKIFSQFIPLYDIGFGWIFPCALGIILGFIWKAVNHKEAL